MADVPSPPAVIQSPRSNLPMLYYGVLVVGTAAIVLLLYNIVIIKWCADFADHRGGTTRRIRSSGVSLISSFKYYKRDGDGDGGDSECVVCLSAFEEGEEVKQLPKCSHCFHAPCIDMWLYSHSDCPLCRSPVQLDTLTEQPPTALNQHTITVQSEHSREILLGSALFA